MIWNWQQVNWPLFSYQELALKSLEAQFLQQAGLFIGTIKHVQQDEQTALRVEIMSDEALKTSEIEGEYLNRDSVQSSIRRQFGLASDHRQVKPPEQGIANMMVNLHQTATEPLSHTTLFNWHRLLTNGRTDIETLGAYRQHSEPMQIISGSLDEPKIHFEAPPSVHMKKEMDAFIDWFNNTAPSGKTPLPALTRASTAHLYFVSIHPFEDGNGRIARALVEKALSQAIGQPVLLALSQTIQKARKTYYDMLEASNKQNEITDWLVYFAQTILAAQSQTQIMVDFLIEKTKLFDQTKNQLNERQKKAIDRIFRAGPEGFQGGLSAENYINITKTSRATATRDLQDLVDKHILLKNGMLKSTRYHLNNKRNTK